MTRWLFAVWLLAIAVAAHMLFEVEQEVRILEDELSDMDLAILTESDALRALQADWSFLNWPERLAALSEEHLSFLPMRPRQITQFSALPMRLDDDKLLELALAREGVPMPKRKPPMERLGVGPLADAVLSQPALVGEPVADRICRAEGFGRAAHFDSRRARSRLWFIGERSARSGRNEIVDVLCVR